MRSAKAEGEMFAHFRKFVVGRLGNTGYIKKFELNTHRPGGAYKETYLHEIYLLSSFEYRKRYNADFSAYT